MALEQIIAIVYLCIGLALATLAVRMDQSSGSPPEISGFMMVTLVWPAIFVFAIQEYRRS